MDYDYTLEKAGAEVLAYESFGDYQGTWLAFVNYNGQKGIVEGSYGSCSVCDSLQAEFGYSDEEIIERDGKYYEGNNYWDSEAEITKERAEELNKSFNQKICEFGSGYLHDIQDLNIIETRLKVINDNLAKDEDAYFDREEKEYLEWAVKQFEKFK